jgi:hypothetical protein
MNDEQKEKLNKMKEQINVNYLGINRVPKKELEWFLKWCDEEFEGDRGMALKWLCQGYMPPENVELIELIKELSDRINRLELSFSEIKTDEQVIKLADGRKILKR